MLFYFFKDWRTCILSYFFRKLYKDDKIAYFFSEITVVGHLFNRITLYHQNDAMLLKRINLKVFSPGIPAPDNRIYERSSLRQHHHPVYFLKSFHTIFITYLIHFLYFLNQKNDCLCPSYLH